MYYVYARKIMCQVTNGKQNPPHQLRTVHVLLSKFNELINQFKLTHGYICTIIIDNFSYTNLNPQKCRLNTSLSNEEMN